MEYLGKKIITLNDVEILGDENINRFQPKFVRFIWSVIRENAENHH